MTAFASLGVVLVTGASGFIGSRLAARLVEGGVRVRALSRSRPGPRGTEPARADIADGRAVRASAAGVDTVFHLAGLASVDFADADPAGAFRVNTLGAQNVLEAARAAGARRVIVLSTAHVYGKPARLPLTEAEPAAPGSHYAATKLAADVLALGYHRSYGLRTTVLRPTNVYGPGQVAPTVVPTIVESALRHSRIKVRDPSVRRDFVHVDDVVAGLLAAALSEAAVGQAMLLASGRAVPVGEIMRRVAALTGAEMDDPAREPGGKADCLYACAGRAEATIGWRPAVALADGLVQTVAWWRERLGAEASAASGC